MNLATTTGWAFLRAIAVCVFAVITATFLSRFFFSLRGRRSAVAWTLLLAPWFTPALLISYAFAPIAARLSSNTVAHEAFYCLVMAVKFSPVGVVLQYLLPSPLSGEGAHCHRLLDGISCWKRIQFQMRGTGSGPWATMGIVFLLAFGDFEIASLLGIRTWTISLFDAQTGGLALTESLRLMAWPFTCELIVLTALGILIGISPRSPKMVSRVDFRIGWRPWIYLIGAAAFVTMWPLTVVLRQTLTGIALLANNAVFAKDLIASILFAGAAAGVTFGVARALRNHFTISVIAALPGLFGALMVGLLILAAFQWRILRVVYDSPLPLTVALITLLLPLAVMCRWLLDRSRLETALHMARLMRNRRMIWLLHWRPEFAAAFLLFFWAYSEFTASSILAPVGMTPLFVRLHNLAHYGQNSVLSAMLCLGFVAPMLVLPLTLVVHRIYARR